MQKHGKRSICSLEKFPPWRLDSVSPLYRGIEMILLLLLLEKLQVPQALRLLAMMILTPRMEMEIISMGTALRE